MLIPPSAAPALADHQPLLWLGEITDNFARLRSEHHRPRRDVNHEVLAATPGHLRRPTAETVLGLELLILPKGRKRVQRGFDLKDNIAAFAAIAAIRPAVRDELLAKEMHHPIAAFA